MQNAKFQAEKNMGAVCSREITPAHMSETFYRDSRVIRDERSCKTRFASIGVMAFKMAARWIYNKYVTVTWITSSQRFQVIGEATARCRQQIIINRGNTYGDTNVFIFISPATRHAEVAARKHIPTQTSCDLLQEINLLPSSIDWMVLYDGWKNSGVPITSLKFTQKNGKLPFMVFMALAKFIDQYQIGIVPKKIHDLATKCINTLVCLQHQATTQARNTTVCRETWYI